MQREQCENAKECRCAFMPCPNTLQCPPNRQKRNQETTPSMISACCCIEPRTKMLQGNDALTPLFDSSSSHPSSHSQSPLKQKHQKCILPLLPSAYPALTAGAPKNSPPLGARDRLLSLPSNPKLSALLCPSSSTKEPKLGTKGDAE